MLVCSGPRSGLPGNINTLLGWRYVKMMSLWRSYDQTWHPLFFGLSVGIGAPLQIKSPLLSSASPSWSPRTEPCPAAHFLIKSLFNVYNQKKELEYASSLCFFFFLLGEHNMVLHRNTKIHKWVDEVFLVGQKRSTCDHSCLFQDNFKPVMLAHQYHRVNRIAWLCS